MAHPLDGARAKIQRAEEHIKNLDREIFSFTSQKPPPYKVIRQHQNDGRKYAFIVSGEPIVPLRFGVMAGEVVHQLRSSLDHMVYALVIRNGGTPTNQTQFPICSTLEKFKEACARGRIRGVSGSAERIITAEQPYNSPTPDDTLLAALDECDILDKHRLLVVVAAVAHLGQEVRIKGGRDIAITGMSPPKNVKVAREGTEVFSFDLATPAPDFEADADLVLQIAFEKIGRVPLQPVTKMLSLLVTPTKRLLDVFGREFD